MQYTNQLKYSNLGVDPGRWMGWLYSHQSSTFMLYDFNSKLLSNSILEGQFSKIFLEGHTTDPLARACLVCFSFFAKH